MFGGFHGKPRGTLLQASLGGPTPEERLRIRAAAGSRKLRSSDLSAFHRKSCAVSRLFSAPPPPPPPQNGSFWFPLETTNQKRDLPSPKKKEQRSRWPTFCMRQNGVLLRAHQVVYQVIRKADGCACAKLSDWPIGTSGTLPPTNMAFMEGTWKITFLFKGSSARCHVSGREGSPFGLGFAGNQKGTHHNVGSNAFFWSHSASRQDAVSSGNHPW